MTVKVPAVLYDGPADGQTLEVDARRLPVLQPDDVPETVQVSGVEVIDWIDVDDLNLSPRIAVYRSRVRVQIAGADRGRTPERTAGGALIYRWAGWA